MCLWLLLPNISMLLFCYPIVTSFLSKYYPKVWCAITIYITAISHLFYFIFYKNPSSVIVTSNIILQFRKWSGRNRGGRKKWVDSKFREYRWAVYTQTSIICGQHSHLPHYWTEISEATGKITHLAAVSWIHSNATLLYC